VWGSHCLGGRAGTVVRAARQERNARFASRLSRSPVFRTFEPESEVTAHEDIDHTCWAVVDPAQEQRDLLAPMIYRDAYTELGVEPTAVRPSFS
jgi:hypothetical protein